VPAPAPAGTLYTCPMHPQVRQVGAGFCPLCGMALEPAEVEADSDPNPELIDLTHRFWIGLLLTPPVLVLEMGGHLSSLHILPSQQLGNWLQLTVATPVVLWAGWPFFVRGWASLKALSLNMFSLIAMGTGVAWSYSVLATLCPGLFPPALRGSDGAVAVYFEAAAVITVLVLLGQVLELNASRPAGQSGRCSSWRPSTPGASAPTVAKPTLPSKTSWSAIACACAPGKAYPSMTILDGCSFLDASMVTGEAMPVEKTVGDTVIGGTLNQNGSFIVRADRVGRETLLAKIVALVAQGQRSRAPIQRLADQVSGWFVPLVIVIAALAFLAWSVWGPPPRLTYGLIAAVSVLIIACPCALGLATPMSIMVGVGRGGQAGVLIKNAEALERLEQVDTLVVDKTGTLTEGTPRLVAIGPSGALAENELLRLAASLERASQHPLAAAIVDAAKAGNLALVEPLAFDAPVGKGVTGSIEGRQLVIGNARILQEAGIDAATLAAEAETLRQEGATAVFIAIDGKAAGIIAIADPIKPMTPGAVAASRPGASAS
jgi:cation transport ATPase